MTNWDRPFPPSTLRQVEKFEECIGTSLPSAYKEYLLQQNGGSPSGYLSFRIPVLPDDKGGVLLGAMYGLGIRGGGIELATQHEELSDVVPQGYIPIGEDPGGNLLLLAIQAPSIGRIIFWDRVGLLANELGQNFFPVADDINQFLESLHVMSDT